VYLALGRMMQHVHRNRPAQEFPYDIHPAMISVSDIAKR
jgi:hypothetical protein